MAIRANVYYKIPPHAAELANLTDCAVQHPDGWYLCVPGFAARLCSVLPAKGDGTLWTVEEAVHSVGGVAYSTEEAIASARGEAEYMMTGDNSETPEMTAPKVNTENADTEIETETETAEDMNNG